MRTSTFVVCALVSGCAGRYHTEFVGHGTAIVQPRTEIAAATTDPVTPWAVGGGGIQLGAGTYDLAMTFDVPRAQEIEWTVSCPGVQQSGIAGETFERYRERRLAELRTQAQRDRERSAAVASAVVGAFAPTVSTNVGPLHARIDASAVAVHAIPDDVILPASDVGRGRLATTIHVTTTGSGMCVVTAIADDASVLATYQVTRIRDRRAEARVAAMAERTAAMSVRTRVQNRLVAHGADAELRVRQRRAAVEARFAADAKANAEAELRMQARVEQQERWRIEALHARAELRGRCVGHGADPHHRERIADEQRVAAEAEARLRVDIEQRRLDLAITARTNLRSRLVRFGAIARPPMPELLAETPGPPPFEGAVWISGKWTWMNGRWTWTAGGWADPDVFTEVGGDEYVEVNEDPGTLVDDIIDVGVAVGAGVAGAGTTREAVRDHRRPPRERLRDHRTPQRAQVRDHRDDNREHFTPSRSEPPPRSDHQREDEKRDDKQDDDDRGGGRMLRDHRR